MDKAHQLEDEQLVNGICLQFANMIRDEVKAAPDIAVGRWRIESEWTGQTSSVAQIKDSNLGGDDLVRNFSIEMDQPHELCGGNAHASPQEHLIAALAGCFIANFSAVAALRGIALSTLKVSISGTCDMRGLFDIPSGGAAGFKDIRFEVIVAGNASDDDLRSVFDHVVDISPNIDCFGHATPVDTQLVLAEG